MDRYVSPHARPTPHQDELLTILMEEAAEVQIAASKFKRFGGKDGYPGTNRTNATDLSLELGDLLAMIEECAAAGLINRQMMERQIPIKREKLRRFLQQPSDPTNHQREAEAG